MGLDRVIDHLAAYLAFFIEFWQLQGFEALSGESSVSSQVVTFLLAGVGLAYLIAFSSRFPGYEARFRRRPSGREQPPTKPETADESTVPSDIALFTLLLLAGAVVLHACLKATGWMFGVEWGPLFRTLNASIAMQAIYHPVHAVVLHIQRIVALPEFVGYPLQRRFLRVGAMCADLSVGVIGVYGLVVVHQVPTDTGMLAALGGGGAALVGILVAVGFLGWPIIVARPVSNRPSEGGESTIDRGASTHL